MWHLDWRDADPRLGTQKSKAGLSALGTILSLKKLSDPSVSAYAILYILLQLLRNIEEMWFKTCFQGTAPSPSGTVMYNAQCLKAVLSCFNLLQGLTAAEFFSGE